MRSNRIILAVLSLCCGLHAHVPVDQAGSSVAFIDLSNARLSSLGGAVVDKACEMLQQEILARAQIPLPRSLVLEGKPLLLVGTIDSFPAGPSYGLADKETVLSRGPAVPQPPESYALWIDTSSKSVPLIYIIGRDVRGALFGVGRLLLLLEMRPGEIRLPVSTRVASSPAKPIRGHQLGYRNTANSYDAWNLQQFEQYIRDLIVFGTNSIELIPPSGVGGNQGPLMPLDAGEMGRKLSQLIASYGLDVWLWLPIHTLLPENPDIAEKPKQEAERQTGLFQRYPVIDHLSIPGGDPGENPPHRLLPWVNKNTIKNLLSVHPRAQVWISNQGFDEHENEYFLLIWNRTACMGPFMVLGLA